MRAPLPPAPASPTTDSVLAQAAAAAPKLRLVESSRGADPKGLTELRIRLSAVSGCLGERLVRR